MFSLPCRLLLVKGGLTLLPETSAAGAARKQKGMENATDSAETKKTADKKKGGGITRRQNRTPSPMSGLLTAGNSNPKPKQTANLIRHPCR
jgi:hypothetical protein